MYMYMSTFICIRECVYVHVHVYVYVDIDVALYGYAVVHGDVDVDAVDAYLDVDVDVHMCPGLILHMCTCLCLCACICICICTSASLYLQKGATRSCSLLSAPSRAGSQASLPGFLTNTRLELTVASWVRVEARPPFPMGPCSYMVYLGLKVVPRSLLLGLCICCYMITWTHWVFLLILLRAQNMMPIRRAC